MKCCNEGIGNNSWCIQQNVGMKITHVKFIVTAVFRTTIAIIVFVVFAIALFRCAYRNAFHLVPTKMIHEWYAACSKQ